MNSQQPNQNPCAVTLTLEALNWLMAGVCAIPFAVLAILYVLVDWQAFDALPKIYGLIYLVGGLSLAFGPVIILVWVFPRIARLFFPGVYRMTLLEDGLTILAHKKDAKFYLYSEFDRISVERSDSDIAVDFFKGEQNWVFMIQKYKNERDFSRVDQLSAKF